MNTRRWLVKQGGDVAHTFTAATAGKVTSLCGLATVTVPEAHLWAEARDETPHCRDCEFLLILPIR